MYKFFCLILFLVSQLIQGRTLSSNIYKRVIGGTPVKENSITYEVLVIRKLHNNTKGFCGGTLVSDKHVVTATVCVMKNATTGWLPDDLLIGYGNVDANKHTTAMVSKITIDPKYVTNGDRADNNYGIAVVELAKPLKLDDTVSAVHIYDGNIEPGQTFNFAGWGIDADGKYLEILNQVDLKVGNFEYCKGINGGRRSNNGPVVCIPEDVNTGKSPSIGDAGSGYMAMVDNKAPALAAVNTIEVSSNSHDMEYHLPVNVKYHIKFISDATGMSENELFGKEDESNKNPPSTDNSFPTDIVLE